MGIFEKILMDFCLSYGMTYLTIRLWIGLWSALFCIVIVAVDGSAIVRYFTRFTEEALPHWLELSSLWSH